MSRVAIICARGGSKGVPGKNLRLLGGQPLVSLTVRQAVDSELFQCVAVSSDCPNILSASGAAGADCLVERPADLAGDHISVHPAIMHCLAWCESKHDTTFESIVYLQVTSPFREVTDVIDAVGLQEKERSGSVVSACAARSSPYFSIVEERPDGVLSVAKPLPVSLVRRQDAPRCWDLNGAIYVFDRDRYVDDQRLLHHDSRIFEMPPERSLDIDSEFDLLLAQALWELREQGRYPSVARRCAAGHVQRAA